MKKPKVALYWCASCGGCEECLIDFAEDIFAMVDHFDIIFWPIALDFKRTDVEKLKDNEVSVSFINGAIRTSEQREMSELLRLKSQTVIAFGSCSYLGGIPGLANLYNRETILKRVYNEIASVENSAHIIPKEKTITKEGIITLPHFWNTVKTLDQVIDVEYYIPGCPPPVELIKKAITAILDNKLPAKGTVLAPNVPLCEECPRRESKPDELVLKKIWQPHELDIDPEKCLLAQGLICLGPITRKGCQCCCINANMPCTGCMGPTSRVQDFGAKAISAIASHIGSNNEDEISSLMAKIADPVGTFFRYSLPSSFLHRSKNEKGEN